MIKLNKITRKGFILTLTSFPGLVLGCFRGNSPNTANNTNDTKEEVSTTTNLKGKILEPINGGASIIYNSNGSKTIRMDIDVVALNNFELTDKSWESYKRSGNIKKWKIDNGKWKTEPLKNVKVSEKLSGKTLNIKIGFFNPNWQNIETEVFQSIVLLP